MFLHLGKDCVIPLEDIICIIDHKSLKSKDTREFFNIAEEEGFIENITDKKIKSYIITEKTYIDKKSSSKIRKSIIYCSNISSTTLNKRAGLLK
ncbi:extracellular matrix regulator RemB [Caloranaerobacter azorensis]|uniref:DUF370 domain-containing protein n=1 Tax=Caloranaerobacter azorensis TaxID=116090 RepID=A0A6P1YJ82_9FIRM|nr:extracellular matrix/biofilm biosynthesis regulator RemA family protein [Caloranaerobacter azorensis]QIB27856.1 DUF370 domain-containing protein [Caloranaerobacter azorensis]